MLRLAALLVFIACIATSAPALAQENIDTSDLTEQQVKLLQQQADQYRVQQKRVETIKTFATAESIAAQLKKLATEMGYETVDDFLASPTGQVSQFLLYYTLLADRMVQVILGFVFFFVCMGIWSYFFKRMCVVKDVTKTYYENGKLKQMHLQHFAEDEVDGTRFVAWLTAGVMIAISLAIVLTA